MEREQAATCQVPAPVLPVAMVSVLVSLGPRVTFTGGPDTLVPCGAGTQFTGPRTVAGP